MLVCVRTSSVYFALTQSSEFVSMLNAMRFGNIDEKTSVMFRKLSRPLTYDDGIGPTEL
jgi:hypothetical protein